MLGSPGERTSKRGWRAELNFCRWKRYSRGKENHGWTHGKGRGVLEETRNASVGQEQKDEEGREPKSDPWEWPLGLCLLIASPQRTTGPRKAHPPQPRHSLTSSSFSTCQI